MKDGQDRSFLYQNLLRFQIQPDPLLLIQTPLGTFHQAVVPLVPPPALLLNMPNTRSQKVVGIGIVGGPTHDKHMRHLLTQPGEDFLPFDHSPLELDPQILLPLGLQILS